MKKNYQVNARTGLMAFVLCAGLIASPAKAAELNTTDSSLMAQLSTIVQLLTKQVEAMRSSVFALLGEEGSNTLDAQLTSGSVGVPPRIANRHPAVTNFRAFGASTAGKETKMRIAAWDPNGDPFTITVDFGDGDSTTTHVGGVSTPVNTPFLMDFGHLYKEAGPYVLKASVYDEYDAVSHLPKGGKAETELKIVVNQVPAKKTALETVQSTATTNPPSTPSRGQVLTPSTVPSPSTPTPTPTPSPTSTPISTPTVAAPAITAPSSVQKTISVAAYENPSARSVVPPQNDLTFLRFRVSANVDTRFDQIDVKFADVVDGTASRTLTNIGWWLSGAFAMAGETRPGTFEFIAPNVIRLTKENLIAFGPGSSGSSLYELRASIPAGILGNFKLGIVRLGSSEDPNIKVTGLPLYGSVVTAAKTVKLAAPILTGDKTPRLAVKAGLMPRHMNPVTGEWQYEDVILSRTNSGLPWADKYPHWYCILAYPDYNITGVTDYKYETIENWRSPYNSYSTEAVTTVQCVGTKK